MFLGQDLPEHASQESLTSQQQQTPIIVTLLRQLIIVPLSILYMEGLFVWTEPALQVLLLRPLQLQQYREPTVTMFSLVLRSPILLVQHNRRMLFQQQRLHPFIQMLRLALRLLLHWSIHQQLLFLLQETQGIKVEKL